MLSAGQRQRVGLAGPCSAIPAYIVLDEPNAALDAEARWRSETSRSSRPPSDRGHRLPQGQCVPHRRQDAGAAQRRVEMYGPRDQVMAGLFSPVSRAPTVIPQARRRDEQLPSLVQAGGGAPARRRARRADLAELRRRLNAPITAGLITVLVSWSASCLGLGLLVAAGCPCPARSRWKTTASRSEHLDAASCARSRARGRQGRQEAGCCRGWTTPRPGPRWTS